MRGAPCPGGGAMPLIIYLGFAVRRYVILLSQYYVVEYQTSLPLQVNRETE